jgi:hypothetical protein
MRRLSRLPAFGAAAERAQELPRVEARRVSVTPHNLEGIGPDLLCTLQGVFSRKFGLRFGRVGTEEDRFTLASGTRAIITQRT